MAVYIYAIDMYIIDIILEPNEEFINNILFFLGFALECYVCLGQRTNKDKCIKTTIQCEQEQDACKTQIRWQRKYFYIYVRHTGTSYQSLSLFLTEFLLKNFSCHDIILIYS